MPPKTKNFFLMYSYREKKIKFCYGGDEASTTIMAKVLQKGVQFLGHGFESQKKKKKFPLYRKWEQHVSRQGQIGPAVHRRGHKSWSLALQTVQPCTFPPGSNPENV